MCWGVLSSIVRGVPLVQPIYECPCTTCSVSSTRRILVVVGRAPEESRQSRVVELDAGSSGGLNVNASHFLDLCTSNCQPDSKLRDRPITGAEAQGRMQEGLAA